MSVKTQVESLLRRQIADDRKRAEAEFSLRESTAKAEALKAEQNALVLAKQWAEDEQRDIDAKGATRIEGMMASMELDISELGTPEERGSWLAATGLSKNALSLAASAGSIDPWFARENLGYGSTDASLQVPHVRHLLAIATLRKLYLATLSAEAQAREDALAVERHRALDRVLAQQDAEYAAMAADVRKLEA